MQVSVETTSGLERRLTIAVPAGEFDDEVSQKLAEVAKNARINGFRKGKVPLRVVSQHYGQTVRQEVAGDVINDSYAKAIEKASVKPAGYPKIQVNTIEAGKDLEYVAIVEVYPEVTLGSFDGYEITRLASEIVESDVDAAIEELRDQQASFSSVDRPAEMGDQITIDFLGTKDGEAFEGGTANGHQLTLGSGAMIPGFEEAVAGMAVGEEKQVPLTFPEDYRVDNLKGAAVEFKITLHTVEEKQLPEINDDFVKKFGSVSMDTFRDDVRSNMDRELSKAIQGKLKSSVMDQLVDAHQLELPKALIDSEIEVLRKQMMQQFGGIQQNQKLHLKSLLPDEMFAEQAQRRAILGLIIGEIVTQNEIKVDPERVKALIEENASSYDKPEEVVEYYYQNEQLLSGVESIVLEDMVVDTVLSAAQVTEKSVGYAEAVASA